MRAFYGLTLIMDESNNESSAHIDLHSSAMERSTAPHDYHPQIPTRTQCFHVEKLDFIYQYLPANFLDFWGLNYHILRILGDNREQ